MATVPWKIPIRSRRTQVLLSLALLDRYRQLGRPPAEFELYDRSLPVRRSHAVAGRSRYAGSSRVTPPNAATMSEFDRCALSF